MKAAVLHAPQDLRVEDAPDPTPGPGEAVVKVRAAGLCGTDYRIWSGDRPVRYPLIMGHEFIGDVVAVGAGVERVKPGDPVAVEPNYSCGHCSLCLAGNRNLCLKRTAVGIDVGGGFAELDLIPASCCWPAPPSLAEDQLLLAEPLAVVVRAVARGEVQSGESAAVLGVGTLGLLAIQVLRARGARVLAVGRSSRRLPLAKELGAEAVHCLEEGWGALAARHFTDGDGVDVVVETAGTHEAVGQAVELVRPGGRVILTGLPHEASRVDFFWVVRRELRIIGSMIYQDEFSGALSLLDRGLVQTTPLVTHRFPLDQIHDAFTAHRSPDSIKVALVP
jgi:2-desacetyl-2-hydroxyethyl bacteriochlorophyllide A dehydrogenase